MPVDVMNTSMDDNVPAASTSYTKAGAPISAGTELSAILAPGGRPLLTFSKFVGAGTSNTLEFIIADTNDAVLDSTVFISALGGAPPAFYRSDVKATDPDSDPITYSFIDSSGNSV